MSEVLQEQGGRATGSASVLRLRSVLVTAEVAVVVVLLIGAGLMLRSFAAMLSVDPGFPVERRLAVQIHLPPAVYPDADAASDFFDDLRERIQTLPDVTDVGTVSTLPFTSPAGYTGMHILESRPLPRPGSEPIGGVESVGAGYFEAMGIPLLAGRHLTADDDRPDAPAVAVINEAMWRRFWPDGEDPWGRSSC